MSLPNNPFLRGYWGLDVQRVLEIRFDTPCLPVWRPLHPSQAHLSDDQIALKSCLLCHGYAVVTQGQRIPRALRALGDASGSVAAVRYAIHADDDGQPVRLGDVSSPEEAREIIRRLSFETGLFNRCWEISDWHLDRAALDYLAGLASASPPCGPLFSVFRLGSGPLGVRLIGIPWNDAHLRDTDGTTVAALRQALLQHGAPRSLANALLLAGEADVRFLVFDGGAPRLDGLSTYDHD